VEVSFVAQCSVADHRTMAQYEQAARELLLLGEELRNTTQPYSLCKVALVFYAAKRSNFAEARTCLTRNQIVRFWGHGLFSAPLKAKRNIWTVRLRFAPFRLLSFPFGLRAARVSCPQNTIFLALRIISHSLATYSASFEAIERLSNIFVGRFFFSPFPILQALKQEFKWSNKDWEAKHVRSQANLGGQDLQRFF
jgi:hypothetical protein